eukprot:5508236-Amphidinium_carterae.1
MEKALFTSAEAGSYAFSPCMPGKRFRMAAKHLFELRKGMLILAPLNPEAKFADELGMSLN